MGASLDVIKERRAQRPEARAAARQAAIAKGKEAKKDAESVKKAKKAKEVGAGGKGAPKQAVVSKQMAKGKSGGGKR